MAIRRGRQRNAAANHFRVTRGPLLTVPNGSLTHRRPYCLCPCEYISPTPQKNTCMMLIEREEELSALHNLLSESRCGKGQVVVVHGAAGNGKSELLYAFA